MANDLINGEGAGQPASSTQDTSVWMYRGQEAKLFASSSDVPKNEGWKDAPYDLDVKPEAPAPAPKTRKAKAEPVKDADGDSDGN